MITYFWAITSPKLSAQVVASANKRKQKNSPMQILLPLWHTANDYRKWLS